MNDSRTVPPPSDFDELDPEFTDDERDLVTFLDDQLPPDWSIYARPHLNGEWPSVAVLHPSEGLVIYDVLQWEGDQFEAETQEVIVDGQSYNMERYVPRVYDYNKQSVLPSWRVNPRQQVERYRRNLTGIYLPRLGEAVENVPKYVEESICVGLYCPQFTTKEARDKFGGLSNWASVFGHDHLTEEALETLVVPVMGGREDLGIEDWADGIRFFLNPPFHSEEEGNPIDLSRKQEKYTQPRPGTHRRLKGVAGSGKTLVVAHRAARNASEGDRVLVVFYNITLGHYIRHLIDQAPYSFQWSNIEILHFHGFCSLYLRENGIDWPEDDDDEVFTKGVPEMVSDLMEKGINTKNRKYDAILIDEGQDFDESWFGALSKFLVDSGEVLLVADERQNIYDRIHTFEGMSFSGPWGSLESSYRMPSNLIREVNRFADSFVDRPDEEFTSGTVKETSRQAELGFIQPTLVWKNFHRFERASQTARNIVHYLTGDEGVHPEDIVVLVPRHAQGKELATAFRKEGYAPSHIFGKDGSDQKSRKRKQAFIMDDGRLKLSTIHSFKGWELANIILITPESGKSIPPKADLNLLLYTAITRAQNSLFVLNQHPKYTDYGEDWPSEP